MAYSESFMATPSLPCPSLPPAAYAHQFDGDDDEDVSSYGVGVGAGAGAGGAWSCAGAPVMPLGSMVVTADGFASSLLAQPAAPRIPDNEKEPVNTQPSCGSSAWRDEKQPQSSVCSSHKSRQSEADRQAAQYRDMKLRYMRTLAAGSRRAPTPAMGFATPSSVAASPPPPPRSSKVAPLASSPSSAEREQRERCEKSHSEHVSPALGRPSLLSQLLSSRPPLSRPVSPDRDSSSSSSSSSSCASSPSSVHTSSPSSSRRNSSMVPAVPRSSPIAIPSRSDSKSDDGGVRYRRAVRPTRDEKQQQVRELRSASASPSPSSSVAASVMRAPCEFTFTDVFGQPAPLAASMRPTRAPVPVPAMPLRSRLLDSFLAH